MIVMDTSLLQDKINAARANRLINNFYASDVSEKACGIWENGDEFVFAYEDHGINRLIFFVKDLKSIDVILKQIHQGKYFIDIIGRNRGDDLSSDIKAIAHLKRYSNPDCRSVFDNGSEVIIYKGSVSVETALEEDASELNKLLWSTFNTEVSHLLFDDELRTVIRSGQISLHRNDEGIIDALLQADVLPKKFYINQIINKSCRKEVIHSILLDRLEGYVANGGKYLYSWIEETNNASLKFHEKYGMKHDGLWNTVYCLER